VELLQGRRQIGGGEVGPQLGGEGQLGVGALPEQEVGQALLAAGTHQQIHVGDRLAGVSGVGQEAREAIARQLVARAGQGGGAQDGVARGVVDGDAQVQALAAGGGALGLGDGGDHLGGQAIAAADHAQAHAVLHAAGGLLAQVGVKEVHEPARLLEGAPPVVRREGVEGEGADAEIGRRLHDAIDGVGAAAVALEPRHAPAHRPAAVAVHDDGHVQPRRSSHFCAHVPRLTFRARRESAPPCG
jgi:hypothetical protein